jgi:hypothetical protein
MRTWLANNLVTLLISPTPAREIINEAAPTRTPLPSFTPTEVSEVIVNTATPAATLTSTPQPAATATATPTSISENATASPTATTESKTTPTATPVDTTTPTVTPIPSPTATPLPTYDFMLAEFFNSPTTNSFLLVYVAIVDLKDIPIGDMRIVGTREKDNRTFQSPFSTWHYEGYNAPAHVMKTGNVKFEPPGGIETGNWRLHLVDTHGQQLSEDIVFIVDQENPQWYFIKLRRKF